ncbi:MAG: 16S rRNA (cytosine(1402)-N(4))-methyltransferase RsmH [Gammaproteobacteria bacterium]|jgi:16S rRNA (cytosine1402-N4)-methyltransferase|nr:16S rRNA (cytosine(1402)-N(4))-methyltransferase RsmH [Gammaproteobacteria bacterium]MDH3748986.1 16S rRNA (cytosine(1402)-N(4))-methyltransferase RsmH [Gammaproteobacteria bacterium]
MSSDAHVPVLLGPVLEGLNIKQDGLYVDGTFGRGGHSSAILKQMNADGRLIAIDRDPQAIASAAPELTNDSRFTLMRGDFANLATCIGEKGLTGRVDGLLFDLGVSSPQLDAGERGFSFLRDGPLDMRMDPDSGVSAAEYLHSVEERELRRVIRQFGDERHATRIAREIVATRDSRAIETTRQLADIVVSVVPAHRQRKHPATKTFQAIRIFINGELEQLEAALVQSLDLLAKGGRLCVISFHSLEDRIVKRFIRDASREAEPYRGMPDVPEQFRPKLKPIGKAIVATAEEIAANVRARSAHLRIAERT